MSHRDTDYFFRYDFELFNYSLKGYLDAGQPDKDPAALLAAITMKDPALFRKPMVKPSQME